QTAITNGLRVGEGFLRFRLLEPSPGPAVETAPIKTQSPPSRTRPHPGPLAMLGEGEGFESAKADFVPLSGTVSTAGPPIANLSQTFYKGFACPVHQITMGELFPYYFSFNDADSACPTCLGLGVYLKVHPDLLVPDKKRSIKGGAFIAEAFKYDKNAWH